MPASPVPTPSMPPMSPKVREIFYGLLSWAAALVVLVTAGVAVYPDVSLPTELLAVSAVVNAAWVYFGFTAKDNIEPGEGRRIRED